MSQEHAPAHRMSHTIRTSRDSGSYPTRDAAELLHMDDCSESSFRFLVWYDVYVFFYAWVGRARAAFDDLLAETVAKLQNIET